MGERFVVVPVDGAGEREHASAVVAEPASDAGGGGDAVEERECGEDSVFESQDPRAAVPILKYNREPNKYGKTAARGKLSVPLLISSVDPRISIFRARTARRRDHSTATVGVSSTSSSTPRYSATLTLSRMSACSIVLQVN